MTTLFEWIKHLEPIKQTVIEQLYCIKPNDYQVNENADIENISNLEKSKVNNKVVITNIKDPPSPDDENKCFESLTDKQDSESSNTPLSASSLIPSESSPVTYEYITDLLNETATPEDILKYSTGYNKQNEKLCFSIKDVKLLEQEALRELALGRFRVKKDISHAECTNHKKKAEIKNSDSTSKTKIKKKRSASGKYSSV